MHIGFTRTQVALAAVAAIGTLGLAVGPTVATAAKTAGKYVTGDFHNHTTCSDGSISMQKLVKKATDKVDTPWGLDWFVQAGHGGNGNRNCTLAEDATLATPVYPLTTLTPPPGSPPIGVSNANITWENSGVTPKGDVNGTSPNRNMWRWQSVQEFQYPLIEYLSALKNLPLFLGIESVVAGHEHSSMSVISGQMPVALDTATLPTTPGPATQPYTPIGSGSGLAKWEYCFDRADADTSRGNVTTGSSVGNNWSCANPDSAASTDPSIGWNAAAQKIIPASGAGTGDRGHAKTVEALKYMVKFHANESYYVPAHLERAGPFNPNGNNGFNVENLRNFNNAAPLSAFGFETQPGHGASDARGEYTIGRNAISGTNVDSVGGTTYGGTGVYGGLVGGVWDALLGEGRNWFFFASSDWHNRGSFGPDDRRSTQDFLPGEYQRTFVMVRNGGDKLRPQSIVDGLRTGNAFSASGQLIDRLGFVACASYAGPAKRSDASVEALAIAAAMNNTDTDVTGCAAMGEKLVVRPGAEIVVSIVVRDPAGTNYSPYSFPNPSLQQVNVTQPLNMPVLDHVDVVRGMVSGYRAPGSAGYSGQWPNDWIKPYLTGGTPSLASVPDAAKNTTASVLRSFSSMTWTTLPGNAEYKKMTFRIPAVTASQYVRLRGSNLPANVPYETDANGNPLPDIFTNNALTQVGLNDVARPASFYLKIPCTTVGTNVPTNGTPVPAGAAPIDGCPAHLPTVGGQKYVAYDVAAWSDLWFYSNPIFVEVQGSTVVAGVK